MAEGSRPWFRLILAAICDFIFIFALAGYLIAKVTGGTTEGGFELNGLPALVLFAIVIAYFWFAPKFGGTLFRRLFRVA